MLYTAVEQYIGEQYIAYSSNLSRVRGISPGGHCWDYCPGALSPWPLSSHCAFIRRPDAHQWNPWCPSFQWVAMTSLWIVSTLKWRNNGRNRASQSTSVSTELFVQTQIKENIKAPHHWPLWGELIGARFREWFLIIPFLVPLWHFWAKTSKVTLKHYRKRHWVQFAIISNLHMINSSWNLPHRL